MSYDLAVWQGEAPSDNREAARVHERLYAEYLEADDPVPVVTVMQDFLSALTDRWPDTNTDDNTPWAYTPLIRSASGPYAYIGLSWGAAELASAFIAETASSFGLVCFDPQAGSLRSSR